MPPGVFKTGAVDLRQGVELHLEAGAVLLGSTDLADYPVRTTRIEGHFEPWRPALVNAAGLTGVRITGPGTLDGNGRTFWQAFWKRRAENPKCTNLEVERPRLLFVSECRDVTVEGIRLKDSGFWNLHVYKCRGVTIEGVAITAPHGAPPKIIGANQPWDEVAIDRAPSSDGIDVDRCQDVTIRRCRIGADVPLLRLKLRPDTPQLYESIVVSEIEATDAQAIFDVKPWTQFFDLQGHPPQPSRVRGVTIRGVRGTFRSLGELRGNAGDELTGVTLVDVDVVAKTARLTVADGVAVACREVRVNGTAFTVGPTAD